jgi:putative ABC transport system permease protein
MFRNYFKAAVRILIKDKWYALINISSLTIGMVCFSLLSLFVWHEANYDTNHWKAERIYRLIQVLDLPGGPIHEASSSIYMADALLDEFPEIESAAPVFVGMPSTVRFEQNAFVEENFILSTQNFLQIFDLDFVVGDPQKALSEPFSVILTQETANKYFGDGEYPIGRTLNFSRYGDFKVSGVIRKLPTNSSFAFTMLMSATFDIYLQNVHPNYPARFYSWNGRPCTTYALFKEGASIPGFEAKLPAVLKKYLDEHDNQSRFYVQNLLDMHFNSDNIRRNIGRIGNLSQVYYFVLIGLFVLSLACINYVNLAIARYTKRVKEIGLRKTVGAIRLQLAGQFLSESILLTFVTLLPALFLAELLLPLFNNLTDLHISLEFSTFGVLILLILPITICIGAAAGAYPAIVLSRINPVQAFRASSAVGMGSRTLARKLLVIFQFALSIMLIAATFTMQHQLAYISKKALGFQGDQVIVIEINDGNVRNNYEVIKSELLKNADVLSVTAMTRAVGGYRTPPQVGVVQEGQPGDAPYTLGYYGMDEDALATLLGKMLTISSERRSYQAEVIGVVKDFHYRSLHEAVGPLIIGYRDNPIQGIDDILVKMNSPKFTNTLAYIESIHNRFDQNQQMDFIFLDDMIETHYRSDRVFHSVAGIGAALSILIACMGLFGLASFAVVQRTKEIGIRKVLGATVASIINLLSKEFVKLVLVANLIAWPVAWFAMNKWLQNFAYRVEIGWWVLGLAGGLAFFIALLTVSTQAIKAALANPIEALRYE